ncbi:plasmid pRiA4b ORF-3 family protein [Amycolatopsis sp. H20-H5]|uniref:plasmid pRiA4b ORF-3 family protein n=1 Tax=Amycolatopsis sp. H20-H5 TaxID=3046309 RepID=UPI002DBB73CB|nr:plasmid pRiA4b ORF-3 family protein [Amycolatopsis sp. H20-H5]MEC3978733.1 plasmid pRiA4b ORF-3 family protein [Amycolatopsis sp. H20-H5]
MPSDLSSVASACPVVEAAVRLAGWVGKDGIPVTAGRSLRPADVVDAARALGVSARTKVRRAADVPEVHRPWLMAVAAGLVVVADNRAVRGGRLDDPQAAWWAGLQALLVTEAADTFGVDPRITALVTLTVVASEQLREGWTLQHRVEGIMHDRADWDSHADPQRHGRVHPAEAALAVLRLFGAIEGTRLTPLGVWAGSELRRVVPPQVTPELPAKDLLGLLAGTDEVDAWNRATHWFGERTSAQIVAELAQCAAEATPAQRVMAIGLISALGDDAVAALRTFERSPNLAAHVRVVAHQHEQAPEPRTEDLVWLATEYAHADLSCHDVATARYIATDFLDAAGIDLAADGIERITGSGHPDATMVAEALTAVARSAVPVHQLKISLAGHGWRRVLIAENATLAQLHRVIIALFGWDNDHLHVFTVGRRSYSDPFYDLEETVSEDTIGLHQALPQPKATMSYTYDLGATWRHQIVLEKVLDDHPLSHPECLIGQGDHPIEYYDPDDPTDPVPFDVTAVNKTLNELGTKGY